MQAASFKPGTIEYFTSFYSSKRDLIEQMLLSEDPTDQLAAKVVLAVVGVQS